MINPILFYLAINCTNTRVRHFIKTGVKKHVKSNEADITVELIICSHLLCIFRQSKDSFENKTNLSFVY